MSEKVKEISVFVDEPGSFDPAVETSQFYLVCMVFHDPVKPGKYTLVLANRARKKGSDCKLCRHCRDVTVVAP